MIKGLVVWLMLHADNSDDMIQRYVTWGLRFFTITSMSTRIKKKLSAFVEPALPSHGHVFTLQLKRKTKTWRPAWTCQWWGNEVCSIKVSVATKLNKENVYKMWWAKSSQIKTLMFSLVLWIFINIGRWYEEVKKRQAESFPGCGPNSSFFRF